MDFEEPAIADDYLPLDIATFETELQYRGLTKKIKATIPLPLPDSTDADEFIAHIVSTQKIPDPLRPEFKRKFKEFLETERQRLEDERDDKLVTGPQPEDLDLQWNRVFEEQNEKPSTSKASLFGDYFLFIMENSSAERLALLMEKEVEMAHKMGSIVRARDWELDSLRRECESLMESTVGDAHPHELSRLNEKMRHVHNSYTCQIEALVEKQKLEYKRIITTMYEIDAIPRELIEADKDSNVLISRSFSHQDSIFEENGFDESFTIYLGAQLKTMHNVRLLARKRPLNGPLGANISQRLQSAMSLYRRGAIHGVVILVDKHPMWHSQERTDLARACEKSTELHFEPLTKQLENVQNSIQQANRWRCEQQAIKMSAGKSLQTPFDTEKQREECSLQIGDLYSTRHSNLDSVQVLFHLVVDTALKTGDITSRHPCLSGLRNVIRACSRFGVTSISIPLLLVEEANEVRDLLRLGSVISLIINKKSHLQNMTVQWCVKRAELVFKCVKGYLMEVCGSGWESSAPGGPALSHSPHYNINFVLPSGLGPSVLSQITSMFPTIFHLVPSKSA